ncbi:cation transporter [Chryseobacterium sp. FH1]|uniref:cation transporter n=1 Tax=Chryseobacterium sp. FH1 TaxID=1233951 RepID=UPI0009DF3643|nr:cation transporter [Chryseobacterium sp. FH1]
MYSALVANLLITLTQFIAGAITNGSSMISEGIHSTIDTTYQLLLLYGLKGAKNLQMISSSIGSFCYNPAGINNTYGICKNLNFKSPTLSVFYD